MGTIEMVLDLIEMYGCFQLNSSVVGIGCMCHLIGRSYNVEGAI
jgi:hypothetical protein